MVEVVDNCGEVGVGSFDVAEGESVESFAGGEGVEGFFGAESQGEGCKDG